MKYYFFILFLTPLLFLAKLVYAEPLSSTSSILIAQNESEKDISPYDPFANYAEFENSAEEQEDINFFLTGRFLSLGIAGGTQIYTGNMANLYNIGPAYSIQLTYFFDLTFAIQFSVSGGTSVLDLELQSSVPFKGAADFISLGIDVRYFIDKSIFSKGFSWFQPYFFVGVLHSTVDFYATYTDQSGFYTDDGFGINMGLGVEFHFSRKMYLGIEYAFKFVTLSSEAVPIELTTSGNTTINTNFTPYGDWMHVLLLLGVNF